MARRLTLNHSLGFAGTVIAILVLSVAFAALAQVAGGGQRSAKDEVISAHQDASVPSQAMQAQTVPGAHGTQRALVSHSEASKDRTRSMDQGQPLFLPAVTYSANALSTISAAVADVNGDGKPDIVLASLCSIQSCSLGAVSVLLGNGDGTFQPAVVYDSGGGQPFAVAVADVNGDGKPDVVVANFLSSNVALLVGNGDGTFQPAVVFGTGGVGPYSVAIADVNGDGKPDLVVANVGGPFGIGNLGVLLGNGDGTFQSAVTYGNIQAESVAITDVNHDGKPDLLAAGLILVDVLLGNGDGTFQRQVGYPSGASYAQSVTVADVNGDGRPDLLVANASGRAGACSGAGYVSLLMGNGDGTFQPAVLINSGGCWPAQVATADVNGDGKVDLLVANDCDSSSGCPNGSAGVLLGNGDGTFQPVATYLSGGTYSTSIAVADLNADGKPDVVLANSNIEDGTGSVSILLNNSSGHQNPTTTALASSLNPSVYGQAVTFTATVSSTSGTPPNGETVTFNNGSATLGTGLLSGGVATLTTSTLAAGVYTITASYPGDSTFAASTSPSLRQVVNSTTKSATSTSFTSNLNPSTYGQRVTFSATVTTSGSVPPTGTVSFTWSGYSIGSATLNSSGVATLIKSNLNADAYPLTAAYKGDTANLGSTSTVVNQVVQQAASTATLTSSPNPSTVGQAVTFTAKITSPTVTAKGPVTFMAGKTVLGTVELSGGKATLTTSSLSAGSTVVTVIYNGDSNIAKSSASVTQTVQP
jgi:hypothetical protein